MVPLPDSLAHALFYAELGWEVFPVHSIVDVDQCSCGNSGCANPGKHPRTKNGLKNATTDEDTIRAWWTEHPDANIGVATGSESGLWVWDVDTKDDGIGEFERLQDERELCTIEQITGSGGRHLFFAWDSDLEVRNATAVIPGNDVRGEGGYVIVPPSSHVSGQHYQWAAEHDPARLECAPAPPWLLEIAASSGQHRAAESGGLRTEMLLGPLPAEEVRAIRSALGAISPDCDRDTWVRVGMALHSTAAGDQAFAIWDEWSSEGTRTRGDGKRPVYPGTQDLRTQWHSFARKDDEVRLPTLFYTAQEAGWKGLISEGENGHVEVQLPTQAQPDPLEAPWPSPEAFWVDSKVPKIDLGRMLPVSLRWLQDWLEALSTVFQVPVDFPAAMALAMASSTIAGKRRVLVPGAQWREHAPLWFVCAMPSGMGKSICFEPLVEPFRDYEVGLNEVQMRADYEAKTRAVEIRVRIAERNMAAKTKAAKSNFALAQELQQELSDAMLARAHLQDAPPQSSRILLSDATPEALVEFLQEHHGRALVADPEGGVFDHALGYASGKAPRLDAWLKSYGGETINERRIGDGQNRRTRGRYVKRPLVAVAVATQTDALAELFGHQLATAKGMLARFLAVVVPAKLPDEFVRMAELPVGLRNRWDEEVKRLLGIPHPVDPVDVPLSKDALERFLTWGGDELDAARHGDDETVQQYLSAWNSRFRGKALRISLTLHALAASGDEIGPETMAAALEWMPYLRAHHGLLGFAVGDDPEVAVARRVLSWARRRGLGGQEFTRREVYQGLKGSNTAGVRLADDLNGPLALLVDADWIRPATPLKQRRYGVPSAKRYVAHPDLTELYDQGESRGT